MQQDILADDPERQRLAEMAMRPLSPWRRFGPYLSERQWGTVREDYSSDGTAWEYLPHDHARSRAYRWGEDGIAGISDIHQHLCFALALWNGEDPILKERLFGLTGNEGNHGEDVKEYYFYLDNLPSHAYMKMLYKYPHHAFPYAALVEENRRRSREEPEFELIDTGIFDGDEYFDVFVEYAKNDPSDLLVRIAVTNRASVPHDLHVLPHAVVSQRLVVERPVGAPRTQAARKAPLGERDRPSSPQARAVRFLYVFRRRVALHGKRNQ